MRFLVVLLTGAIASATFVKSPPKPDPNRHLIRFTASSTVPVATSTATGSVSSTIISSATSAAQTSASSISSIGSTTSTDDLAAPNLLGSFKNLLDEASQAPVNVNAFSFVQFSCDSSLSTRPDYCDSLARTLVQATEAYTSVFAFPLKINVGVKVDHNSSATALAECAVARRITIEQTNTSAIVQPAVLVRHQRLGLYDHHAEMDRNAHQFGTPDLFMNVFDNKDWSSVEGNSSEEKYDLLETILHELAHGLGMLSSWTLYMYKGVPHLVPTVDFDRVFSPDMQTSVFKKVLMQASYDMHIHPSLGNPAGFEQDAIKLSQLLAPNGDLSPIGSTRWSENMGLDTWPEAALEFSRDLARRSERHFRSTSNKSYLLYRTFSNEVAQWNIFSHLSSLYSFKKDSPVPTKDFLMTAHASRVPLAEKLQTIYGKANVPVKEAIGPALRDILTTIGWKLRE